MTDETTKTASTFCVIGLTAGNYGRNWKTDKEAAIAHAKKLIRNSATTEGGQPKTRKLLVVQVVSVVEVPGPQIDARDVNAEDVEDLTSAGE